jgi:5-(carboxyamino)imidazole ribonucleotide mutase
VTTPDDNVVNSPGINSPGAAREDSHLARSPRDSRTPIVAVVMGSSSDLSTMRPAIDVLERFDVPHEVRVLSAHRTPDDMLAYGHAAAGRGVQVLIAGAGGAAHLPGMLASVTTVPVVGVPVALKNLDGLDSLLSIVQMPNGVPVATTAINGAANAGLIAVRILALSDHALAEELVGYQQEIADQARSQNSDLFGPEN